ncbi:hypothetical protein CBL_05449 [Carabus blaptoides fortunei]
MVCRIERKEVLRQTWADVMEPDRNQRRQEGCKWMKMGIIRIHTESVVRRARRVDGDGRCGTSRRPASTGPATCALGLCKFHFPVIHSLRLVSIDGRKLESREPLVPHYYYADTRLTRRWGRELCKTPNGPLTFQQTLILAIGASRMWDHLMHGNKTERVRASPVNGCSWLDKLRARERFATTFKVESLPESFKPDKEFTMISQATTSVTGFWKGTDLVARCAQPT